MDNDLLKSIHDDLQQIIQLLGNRQQAGVVKSNQYKNASSPSTRVFSPKETDALLRIIASFKREDDNIQKMLSPQLAKAIQELKLENFKPVEKGYIDTVKKALTYLSATPYTNDDIKAVIKKCPDMMFKADEKGKWYLFISSSFPIEYDPDY